MTGSGSSRTGNFERLFADHYAFILRYCSARLDDRDRAEDAAAETFRVAWLKYREPATRKWLTTIAHHVIGNEYRSRHRARSLEARLANHAIVDDTTTRKVREAVRVMEEADRQILYLTYWAGLTAAEVAGVLRISVPACWARVNRARRRLRQLLTDD